MQYVGAPGSTVLVQLQHTARILTKASSYGTMVTSINGLANGTNGKYWMYYVDGKQAAVGADAYVLRGGEQVTWKFEK